MKYKKGLFIIFVLIALGLSSWRGYQNWETRQTVTEQEKKWEEDCQKLLKNVAIVRVPALIGGDWRDYAHSSDCISWKIKNNMTKTQQIIYDKIMELLDKTESYVLYYKAEGTTAGNMNYTFQTIFQSFLHFKLTGDKQYEVKNPYKINCDMETQMTKTPECLNREVLKICNIESRRYVERALESTAEGLYAFFQTITNNEQTQRQWMKEFYDLIKLFIEMVKADEFLMNPIYSAQFMKDWGLYKKMNGEELEEVSEVPQPYPLPFP